MECSDEHGKFMLDAVRASDCCADIPHAIYHRILNRLVKNEIFQKISGAGRNHYGLAVK